MKESSQFIVERLFKTHKTTTVLKNPTAKEISDITAAGKHPIGFIALNLGKTVYVWNANEKTHEEIKRLISTKWPDADVFYGKGEVEGNKCICKNIKRFFVPEKILKEMFLKDWSWTQKYHIDISRAIK